MGKTAGILQIFMGWENDQDITLVADEEGLYRLWGAVAEAMLSEKGKGSTLVESGKLTVVRVGSGATGLKRFHEEV